MTWSSSGGAEPLAEDTFLEVLSARSRRTNLDRVEKLTQVLAGCRGRGQLQRDDVDRLAELAHQVVGSAGSFGFAGVSELGRDFEEVLARSAEPTGRVLDELDRLAAAMLVDLQAA